MITKENRGSEKRRDGSRHGTHHGGRQPDAIQLQTDHRSQVSFKMRAKLESVI